MDRKELDVDRCPTTRDLEAHARKELVGQRSEAVMLHLKRCSSCLAQMATITRVPSPDDIIQTRLPWWRRVLHVFRRRCP
jgi:hypothetical protein